MTPDTQVTVAPSSTEVECACSPSHRRLRFALTFAVVALLVAIGACLLALALTGGFKS